MSQIRVTLSAPNPRDPESRFIVLTQNKFNEFGLAVGEDSTKRALVAIDPAEDPEEVLTRAKTYQWDMSDEPNSSGSLYDPILVSTEVTETAEEEETIEQ